MDGIRLYRSWTCRADLETSADVVQVTTWAMSSRSGSRLQERSPEYIKLSEYGVGSRQVSGRWTTLPSTVKEVLWNPYEVREPSARLARQQQQWSTHFARGLLSPNIDRCAAIVRMLHYRRYSTPEDHRLWTSVSVSYFAAYTGIASVSLFIGPDIVFTALYCESWSLQYQGQRTPIKRRTSDEPIDSGDSIRSQRNSPTGKTPVPWVDPAI